MSMVNKSNQITKFRQIFPNATMASEWDVRAQIRSTLRELGKKGPTLEWIKSHQDEKDPYETLSIRAQLNCDADHHAEAFNSRNPNASLPVAPIFSDACCQLDLQGKTITHDIKMKLQHARTQPMFELYLCHKNGWSMQDLEDVDWISHSRALNKNDSRRITFVKYLNDWLPLGKQVNRYGARYSCICASCNLNEVEDRDHFWNCPAAPRREWRQKCFRTMKECLQTLETAPPLQDLFLDSLRAMLHNESIQTVPVHPAVAHVAQAQAAIGWHQILKGRISKSWAAFQDQHLGTSKTKSKNGRTWATTVIDTFFKEWWKLWESRNQDRHGSDQASRAQALKAQALRDLQLFYDEFQGYELNEDHRWIFKRKIEERMMWRAAEILQWVQAWSKTLRKIYKTELNTG
jgi:ferredoxin-thioredoxin reductase catalytic subunit